MWDGVYFQLFVSNAKLSLTSCDSYDDQKDEVVHDQLRVPCLRRNRDTIVEYFVYY